MNKSIYNNKTFTKRRQYTLTATAEVVPYGKTRETIKSLDLIAKDKAWSNRVASTYPLIDKYLVSEIRGLLESFAEIVRDDEKLRLSQIMTQFEDGDDKQEEAFRKYSDMITGMLKDHISKKFNKKISSAEWLFGKNNSDNTLPAFLRSIGDEEGALIMEGMKSTLGLYTQFLTSKVTEVQTKVPKRFQENLGIYADNVPIFKRLKESGNEFAVDHEDEINVYSSYDGYLMCYTEDGIETYNRFISGANDKDGIVELGYNGFANEMNNRIRQKDSTQKIYRKADKLKKQILHPAVKQFSIDRIETNEELLEVVKEEFDKIPALCEKACATLSKITPEAVISKNKINWLSQIVYVNPSKINELMNEKNIKGKKFTLGELAATCELDYLFIASRIMESAKKCAESEKNLRTTLLDKNILSCNNVKQRQDIVGLIVEYTSNVKDLSDLAKIFVAKSNKASLFNEDCADVVYDLRINATATNLMRNYITRKLEKEAKKTRLLFDTPTKINASWWNGKDNKFSKDEHTIIRMDGKFYLFTLAPDIKPVVFEESKGDTVDVLICRKAQEAYKKLPYTAFSKPVKAFFEANKGTTYVLKTGMEEPIVITKGQYDLYMSKAYTADYRKKHPDMSVEEFRTNVVKMITLYKKVAHNYDVWSSFDLSGLKDPEEYKNLNDFFSEIDAKTVSYEWLPVDRQRIEQLVESGSALMFLIKTRNAYTEGRKIQRANDVLKNVFSDENMKNVQAIVNAKPALYYRAPLIDPVVTHKAGSVLLNKKDADGQTIPSDLYMELYHYYNKRLTRVELSDEAVRMVDQGKAVYHTAKYDLIKDRRYSQEKFLFTFSYMTGKDIECDSAAYITDDVERVSTGNVMGIVRGAKHLLYYVLQDKSGNRIGEGSLNVVNGIDYYEKLRYLDVKKKNNKKNLWIYDTKCADVKDAYIADAVSEIVKIALENNARIMVEDIYDKSREKWACIDYQVFGKFVDALTKKLSNVIVDKNDAFAAGGLLNPLQLSYIPQNKTIDRMMKGLLIKVSDTYIRYVDKFSGFICAFDLGDLNSAKKKRQFFKNFKRIEKAEDRIEFDFCYSDFKCSKKYHKNNWTVVLSGERSIYNRTAKKHVVYEDIVAYIMDQFKESGDLLTSDDILSQIDSLSAKSINLLFETFRNCLYGVLKKNNDEYRISPVTGKIDAAWMASRAEILIQKGLYAEQDWKASGAETFLDAWVKSLQNAA